MSILTLRLPQRLRSNKVRLDNLTLLPASLLPQKPSLQALANTLPAGATLIVLHTAETPPSVGRSRRSSHSSAPKGSRLRRYGQTGGTATALRVRMKKTDKR